MRSILRPLRRWLCGFAAVGLRELTAYAASPATAVVLLAHAVGSLALALEVGDWLDRGTADLAPLFAAQPWALAVIGPALAMRLWADERMSGTWELLRSLPVPATALVLGKLAAAWAVLTLGLALTTPLWFAACWLGDPDPGMALAGYLGAWLLAGAYLAIGGFASALTRSPVIAFVLGAGLSLALTAAGALRALGLAGAALPPELVDAAADLSLAAAEESFARGLVELRTVLLPLILIVLFGYLTRLAIGPNAPGSAGRAAAPLAGLAAATLAVALGLASAGLTQRLDLTGDGRHALAPETRDVLASLDEPVRLTLTYSESVGRGVPAVARTARRVRELLDTYRAASAGRLHVREVLAEPFDASEDAAVADGLVPAAGPGGQALFLGLVAANSVDDVRVMPLITPDLAGHLDFAVTRRLRDLAWPGRPRIGVVSTLPLAADPDMGGEPWAIWQVLGASYDLVLLDPAGFDRVSENLGALVVVHPDGFSASAWAALDQALMAGLPVVLFVDPFSEAVALRRPPERLFAPAASGLGPLAASLGVDLAARQVVGDPDAAVDVDLGQGGRHDPVRYLPWLDLGTDALGGPARLAAGVDTLSVASAGLIETAPDATPAVTPLVTAGPQAGPIAVPRIAVAPDPRALLRDHAPQEAPAVLAAHLTGQAVSAFPDGPPGSDAAPDDWRAGTDALDLTVVADTDLLDDRFWTVPTEDGWTPVTDNARWIANLLDDRLGLVDLSGLYARAIGERPFTRLQSLRQAAEAAYRDREDALLADLAEAEDQLRHLSADPEADPATLTDRLGETRAELRRRLVETRQELRAVRLALNRDLDRVERGVTAAVLAAPVVAVALLALLVLLARRWRRLPLIGRRRA